MCARPCPLEIIATQPSGDIHNFTDEIKARNFTRLHRLGGEFSGVDAAAGHLRLGVSLRASERLLPSVKRCVERLDFLLTAPGKRLV